MIFVAFMVPRVQRILISRKITFISWHTQAFLKRTPQSLTQGARRVSGEGNVGVLREADTIDI